VTWWRPHESPWRFICGNHAGLAEGSLRGRLDCYREFVAGSKSERDCPNLDDKHLAMTAMKRDALRLLWVSAGDTTPRVKARNKRRRTHAYTAAKRIALSRAAPT
jgi:hypothetical protein